MVNSIEFYSSFDSDHMVFVSPPPLKASKATAPLRPFSILVTSPGWTTSAVYLVIQVWCAAVGSVLAFSLALALLARASALTRQQRGRPVQQQDWRLATSAWFAFSTFIGESVMRYLVTLVDTAVVITMQVRGRGAGRSDAACSRNLVKL